MALDPELLIHRQDGVILFDEFIPSMDTEEAEGFEFRLENEELGVLPLTCNWGYVVQEYDLGSPTLREVVEDRPLNDGTFDFTRYVGPRVISLEVAFVPEQAIPPVGGTTAGKMSTAYLRTRLAAYLHPKHRSVLSFVEKDWPFRRRAVVRGGPLRAPISGPDGQTASVSFVAPSGLIQSYAERQATVPVSDEFVEHVQTVTNLGDVDAHWTMTVRNVELGARPGVEGAGIAIEFQHGTEGELLMIELLDLHTHEELVLASSDRSALIRDVRTGTIKSSVLRMVRATNPEWFRIPPGQSLFGFWVIDADGNRISPKQEARAAVWGPATVATPTDITAAVFPTGAPADGPTLKADPVYGDGVFRNRFAAGEYVVLGDGTAWYYDNDVWNTTTTATGAPMVTAVWQPTTATGQPNSVWALRDDGGVTGGGATGAQPPGFGQLRWHDTWYS